MAIQLSFTKKSLAFTTGYLAVGGFLIVLAGSALYDSANTMQIKSATVAEQIEPVISTSQGTLASVYVQEGTSVTKGQPLFQVRNEQVVQDEVKDINALVRNKINAVDELRQKLELSRLEVSEAQAVLTKTQSLRRQESNRLTSYGAIANSRLQSARSKVAGLQIQKQVAERNVGRFAALLNDGAVSEQAYDTAKSKFADLDADLKAAQEEMAIAQEGITALDSGNYFNGRELVSDLPKLTTDVENRETQVELAQQKVDVMGQMLSQQEQELKQLIAQKQSLQRESAGQTLSPGIYKAPFSGLVAKVMKSDGNTVRDGDTLILLKRDSKHVLIDAYLTQDQAAQVAIGSRAAVKVGTLGTQYQGEVIQVDRTGGLTANEVRGAYQLSGSKDQSAYIRLRLTGVEPTDRNQLSAGTSVVVKLPKKVNVLAAMFGN